MNWKTEWKAISVRISGLSKAAELFLDFSIDKSRDPYNVLKKELLPQAQDIFGAITKFHSLSKNHLPTTAIECIQRFIVNRKKLFLGKNVGDSFRLQAILTSLVSFQTEFAYHISDISFTTQRLVERAFIHLSRSIIADFTIKDRWKKVYDQGETACEKLGAAHLLLHGIWAFKASAKGEKTDLILGEPLRDLTQVESTAEAMVLTEWKVVRNPKKELKEKILEAFKQAKRYSAGILGGFELASYRYLMIVSENVLDMPADIYEGAIIYRHKNIAVDPLPPSKS